MDSVEDNRKVVAKLELDFPILSDISRETVVDYGLLHEGASIDGGDIARPAILLVGPDGRVQWTYVPENYRVRVNPQAVIDAIGRSND